MCFRTNLCLLCCPTHDCVLQHCFLDYPRIALHLFHTCSCMFYLGIIIVLLMEDFSDLNHAWFCMFFSYYGDYLAA